MNGSYKNSVFFDHRNRQYRSLIDDPFEEQILNYRFKKNQVKGKGLSLNESIKSLRNRFKEWQNSENFKNSAINVILEKNPLHQSLITLIDCLLSFEKEFGTKYELPDFPYFEICTIILNETDSKTLYSALECINYSLRFEGDVNNTLLNQNFIDFLYNTLSNQDQHNLDVGLQILSLFGYLIYFSQELCEYLYKNNIIEVIKKFLPKRHSLFIIQAFLECCTQEISIHFLNLVFFAINSTEDELIITISFHSIQLFCKRFCIEPLLTDNMSLLNSLYSTIKTYITSVNFTLIESIFALCSYLPDSFPPDIFELTFSYFTDSSFGKFYDESVKYGKFYDAAANAICHFYPEWHKKITNEFLEKLLNQYNEDDSMSFEMKTAFTKVIIVYYQIQINSFDVTILQLCLQSIESPDNELSERSLDLAITITHKLSVNNILLFECLASLNESRELLLDRLEDESISEQKKIKIEGLLRILLYSLRPEPVE